MTFCIHVLSLIKNLLYVSQTISKGINNIVFFHESYIIKGRTSSGQEIDVQCDHVGKLYHIDVGCPLKHNHINVLFSAFTQVSNLKTTKWHHRMDHLHFNGMKQMQNKDIVFGLPNVLNNTLPLCGGCVYKKKHRFNFLTKLGSTRTSRLFLLSSAYANSIFRRFLLFFTFIDDHFWFTMVYFFLL